MELLLSDDVLACILRRLNPRSLAALLRADLLPLSVYGIFFVEEVILSSMRFFARPLMEHKIAVRFDYLDEDVPRPAYHHLEVLDHRNGLLLLRDWVVNPATRQCTPLPPPPPLRAGMEAFFDTRYLVFDPAVSPHYHVFSIPEVSLRTGELTKFTDETEWPPSPYTLTVFSSTTRRWEVRSFVREGEAATRTTIADINFSPRKHRYAVYWRDALYVHSEDDSIIRITLSTHKYQVIPSPIGRQVTYLESLYLGKSINGVYCALIFNCYGFFGYLMMMRISPLQGDSLLMDKFQKSSSLPFEQFQGSRRGKVTRTIGRNVFCIHTLVGWGNIRKIVNIAVTIKVVYQSNEIGRDLLRRHRILPGSLNGINGDLFESAHFVSNFLHARYFVSARADFKH
ncbi:hypothetical protein VPH35_033493 [Triticum aestivum]